MRKTDSAVGRLSLSQKHRVEDLKPSGAQAREYNPDLAEKGHQARSPLEAKLQMADSTLKNIPEGVQNRKNACKNPEMYTSLNQSPWPGGCGILVSQAGLHNHPGSQD